MTTKEELRAELGAASVELKRLADERDEARADAKHWRESFMRSDEKRRAHQASVRAHERHGACAESEVARLQEALAAAERSAGRVDSERAASSLAAANALLGQWLAWAADGGSDGERLERDTGTHLANQPAAPNREVQRLPPRQIPEEQLTPLDAPTRTEAEQRVLDACEALDLSEAKLDEDGLTVGEVEAIVDAVLALREEKR